MPNWCDNSLCITAKSKKAVEDLKKFKELAFTKNKYPSEKDEKDLCLDFEKFAPYPEEVYEDKKEQEEIENLRKKGKDGEANKLEILYKIKQPHKDFNWYEWNCKNWGTKWNARPYGQVTEEDNRLVYRFDTAWSPPLPIILKMSVLFPNLIFKIKYYECGMGFKGILECKAGNILKDIYKNNL